MAKDISLKLKLKKKGNQYVYVLRPSKKSFSGKVATFDIVDDTQNPYPGTLFFEKSPALIQVWYASENMRPLVEGTDFDATVTSTGQGLKIDLTKLSGAVAGEENILYRIALGTIVTKDVNGGKPIKIKVDSGLATGACMEF